MGKRRVACQASRPEISLIRVFLFIPIIFSLLVSILRDTKAMNHLKPCIGYFAVLT